MLSIGKTITLIVPLVSYIAYKAAYKPLYLPLSCSLVKIGCPTNIPIHGFVDDEYKETYDIFVNNLKKGLDIGASISAYVDGHQVLSLQGGWQNVEEKIEYTNETLQMVFSSTKALDAIIVAQLVEQGLLSYDERISTYWPEFAQGNKENVTLMDLQRHTAGICCLDNPISYENVSNPDILADILAKQSHAFGGEPIHAYHAITQGWVQNVIIRRVDPQGRTIDDFAREFKDKWGSEWYLKPDATEGVDLKRIAPFYTQSTYQQFVPLITTMLNPFADKTFIRSLFDKNSLYTRSIVNAQIDQTKGVMNSNPKHRAIEGPSYSGHTNADSIAKLAAMMANRGKAIVPGEPDIFNKDDTYEEATRYIDSAPDAIFNSGVPILNLRGGFMFFPNKLAFQVTDDDNDDADFIGGMGAGGSVFVWNEKYKIGFAYVMNGFTGGGGADERSIPLLKSIFEVAKKYKESKK